MKLVRISKHYTAPLGWSWRQTVGCQTTTQNGQSQSAPPNFLSFRHLPCPYSFLYHITIYNSYYQKPHSSRLKEILKIMFSIKTDETIFNSTRRKLVLETQCSRQDDRVLVSSSYNDEHLCAGYKPAGKPAHCWVSSTNPSERQLKRRPVKTSKLALIKTVYILKVEDSSNFTNLAINIAAFFLSLLYPLPIPRGKNIPLFLLSHLVIVWYLWNIKKGVI